MPTLSEPVQTLLEQIKNRPTARAGETPALDFDVVIVGSGYGGSVAACRLAGLRKPDDKPLKVCVLERGREYQPGEFPEDISRLWPHVQVDSAVGSIGRRDALFDVRTNHGVSALVGCALGGTSQINAGVVLRPEAAVFSKTIPGTGDPMPAWPGALQDRAALNDYFVAVETMLQAEPFAMPPGEPLPKHRALKRLNSYLKQVDQHPVSFEVPPIAVHQADGISSGGVEQKKCTQCGNCCTGCNFRAKNTLTMNYLPLAKQQGAKLYTDVLVTQIAQEQGENGAWRVYLEPNHPRGIDHDVFVRTTHVILAAGVMGTNELLLRSRNRPARSGERAFSLSNRLGHRFSCNGDSIGAGYDHTDFIYGSQIQSRVEVGPCITGMIKVRPETGDVTDQFIVQEGSIPSSLQWIFQELGSLSQYAKWLGSAVATDFSRDVAAPSASALAHSQIYLSMGHDSDGGQLYLDPDPQRDRVRIQWASPGSDKTYEAQDKLLERAGVHLGGSYLPNPVRKFVNEAAMSFFKTTKHDESPILAQQTVTVHPLGGCALADDAANGVVDNACRVFKETTGRDVHAGLYVMDGSVIPTALGANPLLTIAAIAERAVTIMRQDQGWTESNSTFALAADNKPAPIPLPVIADQRVDISFRESLDVFLSPAHTKDTRDTDYLLAAAHAATQSRGAGLGPPTLRLRYRMDNAFQRLLDDPSHHAEIFVDHKQLPDEDPDKFIAHLPAPIGDVRVVGGTLALFGMARTRNWSRLWVGARRELHYYFNRNKAFSWSDAIQSTSQIFSNFRNIRRVLHYLDVSSQKREVIYRLMLQSVADADQKFLLEGFKVVQNRYDLDLLDATTRVFTRVRRDDEQGEIVASGTLVVQLEEFFRPKQARLREANLDTVQIEREADGIIGATALISTATMLAKAVVHPFFGRFREPDYSPVMPVLGEYQDGEGKRLAPRFHGSAGLLRPLLEPSFPRWSFSQCAQPLAQLTRYVNAESDKGPVLLVHGFGTSSLTYAMDTQPMPLARYLSEAGFDVWLLDNRISIAGSHAHRPWGLEDIAKDELREAIWHIQTCTERPVSVFAHCVGGLITLMALLEQHDLCKKIAAVVISQVGTVIEASAINKFKSPIAAFLESYVGLKVVDAYAYRGDENSVDRNAANPDAALQWRGRLIDRALSAYHFPAGEVCDSATCHRVSGMYGLAFKHRNISDATHDNLHRLFGPANMATFKHLARIFDAREPVAQNGECIYLSQSNIRNGLDVPICFIHGADNEVFDIQTLHQTVEQLKKVRPVGAPIEGYAITGYGHQDCIIGNDAHRDVFPLIRSFFESPTDSNGRARTARSVAVH